MREILGANDADQVRVRDGDTIEVLSHKPVEPQEPEKPGAAGEGKPGPGEYFVTGKVSRPGAYSLTDRKVSVKQALIGAGFDVDKPGELRVTVLRRLGKEAESQVLSQTRAAAIFSGAASDPDLEAGDRVVVTVPQAPAEARVTLRLAVVHGQDPQTVLAGAQLDASVVRVRPVPPSGKAWEAEYAPKLVTVGGEVVNRRDIEEQFRAANGDPYEAVLLLPDYPQAVEKLKKNQKVKEVTVESVEPARGSDAGRP